VKGLKWDGSECWFTEDQARARGQSLNRNFGTFFAAFMVISFAGIVLVKIM
jgi:hypothetical protein